MDPPSDLHSDRLNIQMPNVTGQRDRPAASNAGHASVLANANDVHINDSHFSITTNVNSDSKSTLDVLYQRVALNAILNDGGRADDAKCHPGTRGELTDLIEKWADAADSDRILWLTGPAGGGKTAIMKTITERAAKRNVHTVNFFFFRGDSSRQSIQPVVPTLLYQFFEYYPHSMDAVAEIISTRPLIFDGSIEQQCKLISALSPIIRQSSPVGTPVILLVDGLDECDVDAERSQGDILRALEGLLMEDDSPFRLLIASRPEARIKMAFNHLSLHAQTIFLDEQYHPEKDIKRFVIAEFDRIKARHPSAHLLPPNWPSSSDIEEIVSKSSGQFIFAATMMRYIAHASVVPSLSLERAKGIVSTVNLNNTPFKHLDSIYMFILSRVDDIDAVLAIFSLELAERGMYMKWLCEYNSRYTLALVQSCVAELSAIVKLTDHGSLTFYHASLPDFLLDETRSGDYWIDIDAFREKMLLRIWSKYHMSPAIFRTTRETLVGSGDEVHVQACLFLKLGTPALGVAHALSKVPWPDWAEKCGGIPKSYWHQSELPGYNFFEKIQKLYYKKDDETYCSIIVQCIPKWAQILVDRLKLKDVRTLYKEYLDYLVTGGVAEWASAVGNSRVAQCSITSILDDTAINQTQTESHPGGLFTRKRETQQASGVSSPTKHSTGLGVPSPQPTLLSLSASASTQGAPLLSAREIHRATTPLMRPNVQASVLQAKAQESRRPQQPRASESGASRSPAPQRDRVSATVAHASSTRPRPLHCQSLHPPARESSQAVFRSARTENVPSRGIAGAGSSRGSFSTTRTTGHESRSVAPPQVSGGAEKKNTAKSSGGLSGARTTLTPERVRREDHEQNDGDKGSIASDSRATVVKDSTSTNPALRSSSRSYLMVPASRSASSLSVNARVVRREGQHSRVREQNDGDTGSIASNSRATVVKDSTSANPALRSNSRSYLMVPASHSASSLSVNARVVRREGQHSRVREQNNGDMGSNVSDSRATVVKDSTSANPALRPSSRSHLMVPASHSASSLSVNARKKSSTKPTAKPVWRG